MTVRRFELVDDSSSKFWEVRVSDTVVETRHGKLGTAGRVTTKKASTAAQATAAADSLLAQKLGEGYREVAPGTAAAGEALPAAASPKPRAKKAADEPPIPNGLTKAQATRFLKLLAVPGSEYEAWSYLNEKRTNTAEVDSDAARATMNLWAANNGHRTCLGQMSWAPLYTHDELLHLFEVGRSGPDDANDKPLDYVPWYAGLALARGEDLARIVAAHAQAGDWRPARVQGFRLLEWLTGDDTTTLDGDEVSALVGGLAEAHLWNPEGALDRWDPRLAKRIGGQPWTARSLALTLGSKGDWVDALMRVTDEHSTPRARLYASTGRFARLADVFEDMPVREIERFLPDLDAGAMPDDLLALDAFLRARSLDAAELARLARAIAGARASLPRALPSRLVDLLLLQALEENPEAEVDEFLAFSLVDDAWTPRYQGALARMTPARRQRLVERELASAEGSGGGLLGVAIDPALRPLLARYRDKGTAAGAFARKAAALLGADAMAGFAAAPPRVPDALEGWKPRALDDLLASLQDPRAAAASAFFAREALTVLLRWAPRHPASVRLLERLREAKGVGCFGEVIELHEAPLALLEQLSALAPGSRDEEGARRVFAHADRARIDLGAAALSPTWAAWLAIYRTADARPAAAPESAASRFAIALARVRELSARGEGATTRIYALEIAAESTTSYGASHVLGSFPGGEIGDGDRLLVTIDCASVPELAARHPDAACLSVIVPRAAEHDREEYESARVVKVLKSERRATTAPLAGHAITLHALDVPAEVFDTSKRRGEDGEPIPGVLTELYEALWMLPGYVLGDGLWGGELNNRHLDTESTGPDPRFLLTLKSNWIGEDGALFVYEQNTWFER